MNNSEILAMLKRVDEARDRFFDSFRLTVRFLDDYEQALTDVTISLRGMLRENRFTPWFDGSVKPEHPGVYERELSGLRRVFSRWNGRHWENGFNSPSECPVCGHRSAEQEAKWRGLTNPGGE